jgi:hypothetical protein
LPGISTWKERTLRAKNAGSEYLNVEFGWKPVVDEITNMRDTVSNSGKILEQYRADKGKSIRRRYSFPDEVSRSTEVLSNVAYPINSVGFSMESVTSSPGQWIKTTTTTRSRWFSGAFIYGVPSQYFGGGILDTVAEADRLYGLSLTPDVVWNLTPWSWATDWFLNTGDVLSTLSDFISQGLVMKYGYFMEHVRSEVTYSIVGATILGRSAAPPPSRLVSESKTRLKSNPFGFGITYDGLSSSQGAILAALGLSRT